jgi:hypothetical protein
LKRATWISTALIKRIEGQFVGAEHRVSTTHDLVDRSGARLLQGFWRQALATNAR